jgi:tripartite-type tricarboxylate transporter receptor subunit TctC
MIRLIAILLTVFTAGTAAAQERPAGYPARPVRIVYGSVPGGQGDLASRFLAEQLTQRLGRPVVVENRAGANGAIALEQVARSEPDGLTITYGVAGAMVTNPALQPNLPFDVLRDFRPILRVGVAPQCLFVRSGLPARNVREFVELARRSPGELTFASFGVGSTSHLQMELLKNVTNTNLLHVPFRGSMPAMQELVAGRVDSFIIDISPARPFMESGQVRCLAMTGTERSTEFPNYPTFPEEGFPLTMVGWHALFAPAATPTPIVEYLAAEVRRIVTSDEGKAALMRLGLQPVSDGPEETARIHRSDVTRWREVIRAAGIQPE